MRKLINLVVLSVGMLSLGLNQSADASLLDPVVTVAAMVATAVGLLLVVNASPYEADKDDVRLELVRRRAAEAELWASEEMRPLILDSAIDASDRATGSPRAKSQ